MRRQFLLSEMDECSLTARFTSWETIIENNTKWAIIPEYPIPEGYNYLSVAAAVRIPPSYPDEQIDMIYFYPTLALTNGRAINALSQLTIDGKQYQQWSRHRKPEDWRPGVDNISTHLAQADDWLQRELTH